MEVTHHLPSLICEEIVQGYCRDASVTDTNGNPPGPPRRRVLPNLFRRTRPIERRNRKAAGKMTAEMSRIRRGRSRVGDPSRKRQVGIIIYARCILTWKDLRRSPIWIIAHVHVA